MLRESLRPMERDHFDAPTAAALPRPTPATDGIVLGGRYGEGRRLSRGALIAVGALHCAAIGAALYAKPDATRALVERLQVVEVKLEPPAPPDEPPKPEQAPPPDAVLPPMVKPPLQLTPVATPAEVVKVMPPPAPPAPAPSPSPAPVSAPPAPPSVVSEGDIGTRMIAGKPPRYPTESRRKREQGTVVLALMLGLDGSVESIAISRSSGFARLDDAARDAVRRWRWAPTIRNGAPVLVRGVVEIPFVLQG